MPPPLFKRDKLAISKVSHVEANACLLHCITRGRTFCSPGLVFIFFFSSLLLGRRALLDFIPQTAPYRTLELAPIHPKSTGPRQFPTMYPPKWLEYGVPTLDRPFGVALWPLFEKAFGAVMGYAPQDFRFVQGSTPMSTGFSVAVMLISYYALIFSGREFMKGREAFSLNGLFKIHNLYLTIISFVLLVLFIEQLIPTLARHGVFYTICNRKGGWTEELVILYYVSFGSVTAQ